METRDSNATDASSAEQAKVLDPAEGLQEKDDNKKDTKESNSISASEKNEKDKISSEDTASEDRPAKLELEETKMDITQPKEESSSIKASDLMTQEKEANSTKNGQPSNATGTEDKLKDVSDELKTGEIKIKSGLDDEDSLVIDEAGDEDTKGSDSNMAPGSEVCAHLISALIVRYWFNLNILDGYLMINYL